MDGFLDDFRESMMNGGQWRFINGAFVLYHGFWCSQSWDEGTVFECFYPSFVGLVWLDGGKGGWTR